MRQIVARQWGAVALVLWLGGCARKPASTAADFGNEYCALMMPCCAGAHLATDGAMCHQLIGAAAAAGGGTFDSEAGQGCLAEMRSAGTGLCTGTASSPTCAQVFPRPPGTLPPGATCSSDTQCAPPATGRAVCYPTFDASSGAPMAVCAVELAGQAGDGPCLATLQGNLMSSLWQPSNGPLPLSGYTCDRGAGLVCSRTKNCITLRALGATCGGTIECADGAYCDVMTQVCAVKGGAGAPCTTDDACVETAYCDLRTGCTARLATGNPCSPASAQCRIEAACTDGTCQLSPDLGLLFFCGGT
jgi:hypothetical protein